MIRRSQYLNRLKEAIGRSPVTALLGPRQCGKTTLARQVQVGEQATYFDLESTQDLARLQNPELVLTSAKGLIVIDEIQRKPELFNVLRVVVDRAPGQRRFLVLGSASPDVVKGVSESLAGRVEFVDLSGFDLLEVGSSAEGTLWLRGGFPRSFLAQHDEDSFAWREGFLRTFLERDMPQLGISVPAVAMRRFWTMLAHFHGQIWTASEFARSMGIGDKTVRRYLDLLTGTYMVRQLQPWYENVGKRQVKSPKVFVRDSGLLHSLLSLPDHDALIAHPKVGSSWEGFVIEQLMRAVRPAEPYFWATYQGAELDFFFVHRGRRFGVEVKFSEAPKITRSTQIAIQDLRLTHLWVVYPGAESYPAEERITVLPVTQLEAIRGFIDSLPASGYPAS